MRLTDWCSVSRDADATPVCRGEERAELLICRSIYPDLALSCGHSLKEQDGRYKWKEISFLLRVAAFSQRDKVQRLFGRGSK